MTAPSGLADFILSGMVAEIAIAVLVAEFAVLAVFLRSRLRDFLPNALSGLALLVSLREALQPDPSWAVIAMALTGSLAAHAGDLWLRSRRN